MKKRSPRFPRLDILSKKVLEDIRQRTESTAVGVDATYYRAQHGDQLDLLDRLDRLGFLRKDQDKYWVTLQGLILLKDEKSKDLLENCERIFVRLKQHYESSPKTKIMIVDLAGIAKMSYGQTAMCLGYMCEFHFWGGYTNSFENPKESYVIPAETILRYKSFKEIIDESILLKQKQHTLSLNYKFMPSPLHTGRQEDSLQAASLVGFFNAKDAWTAIKSVYDTDKNAFGKRIRFVSDAFKREIIFRDVAQAFLLAETGFSKPAVILAGSVLEELLRLFLESKGLRPLNDTFDGYIKTCIDKGLLKPPVHKLTDSFRQFRNLVHLRGESSSRHTMSKATAKGAVASIFTIVNDLI